MRNDDIRKDLKIPSVKDENKEQYKRKPHHHLNPQVLNSLNNSMNVQRFKRQRSLY